MKYTFELAMDDSRDLLRARVKQVPSVPYLIQVHTFFFKHSPPSQTVYDGCRESVLLTLLHCSSYSIV